MHLCNSGAIAKYQAPVPANTRFAGIAPTNADQVKYNPHRPSDLAIKWLKSLSLVVKTASFTEFHDRTDRLRTYR